MTQLRDLAESKRDLLTIDPRIAADGDDDAADVARAALETVGILRKVAA
jgi:hypothetical protein